MRQIKSGDKLIMEQNGDTAPTTCIPYNNTCVSLNDCVYICIYVIQCPILLCVCVCVHRESVTVCVGLIECFHYSQLIACLKMIQRSLQHARNEWASPLMSPTSLLPAIVSLIASNDLRLTKNVHMPQQRYTTTCTCTMYMHARVTTD